MNTIVLSGVHPEPLSGYLKGLGILRLVSTQADPSARGYWSNEGFVLLSTLSQDDLCTFFLTQYAPSPIVSPWNGGGGFGAGTTTDTIDLIRTSQDPRLANYRQAIESVVRIGAFEDNEEKVDYLLRLRNQLPDDAIDWLDAAAVMFSGGVRYPILLGTGGNDGRLDFSCNFMQRLVDALGLQPPKRGMADRPSEWLTQSLFGEATVALLDAAIGQFDPGGAGGSNSSPHGKGKSLVNPWDFVLMIEGSIVFSGSAVRRQGESSATMSVPFMFQPTAAGYSSATAEKGRGEIWAPLWAEPATFGGVTNLFAEGRVTWNAKNARTGLDAVRAIATLQHDRRIESFARFAVTERFGLSNVAVPVGRISVPSQVRGDVAVTASLDRWLKSIRDIGERFTPASVSGGLRAVDRAIFRLAQYDQPNGRAELLGDVLHEAAVLESMCSRSSNVKAKVRPIRWLGATAWAESLQPLFDSRIEARLAWSLASGRSNNTDHPQSLRQTLCPVGRDGKGSLKWIDDAPVNGLGSTPIQVVLAHAAARREWETAVSASADQRRKGSRIAFPTGGRVRGADAIALATGNVDAELLTASLRAFLLLDYSGDVDGLVTDAPLGKVTPTMTTMVAAVLAHAGAGNAIPSPAGLVRQLSASSPLAVKTLRRSMRIEGLEPMIDDSQMATPWMAAVLLLDPWRGDLADSFASRCGYRKVNENYPQEPELETTPRSKEF